MYNQTATLFRRCFALKSIYHYQWLTKSNTTQPHFFIFSFKTCIASICINSMIFFALLRHFKFINLVHDFLEPSFIEQTHFCLVLSKSIIKSLRTYQINIPSYIINTLINTISLSLIAFTKTYSTRFIHNYRRL